MSKPQPYRIPNRFDSSTLAKQALPGEPIIIVKAVGVGSTAPFEYSDRNGRQAIFRFEMKYDGHVLRVPASIWNANKALMAHDLMDQRRLPHPLVVMVEAPTLEAASPLNGLIDAMKLDLEYAWGWHCNLAMAMHDSGAGPHTACNKGAALFLSLLSGGLVDTTKHPAYAQTQPEESPKSQCGQEVSRLAHTQEIAGSTPATATNVSEMGATDTSENAPNVVGQGDEPTVAPASGAWDDDLKTTLVVAPLYSRAWDRLESPTRLKALAALLETDEDTLKASIQDPLSTVELGHAGWVKRREPQA